MPNGAGGLVELERERVASMRVRFVGVALVSAAIWFSQWFWYEADIFPSRLHSHIYRSGELLACMALVAIGLTAGRLRVLEWAGTATLCALTLLHGFALLVVAESCFVPFLLTLEWGNVVIALAAALSLRSSVVFFGVTWLVGVLSTRLRPGFDADLSDHLVLLVIYATVCLSIRNYDRSRLAAHVARHELAGANRALQQADAARSRLFENLSHDLRTPLALIDGDAQLLEQAAPDPDHRRALQRMRANTRAMTDLIDQLLLMAKLDFNAQAPDRRVLEVVSIVREVIAQFDGGAQRGLIELRPALGASAPASALARADALHLRRILHNLLGNAVRQLTRGASRVWLEVSEQEGSVHVEVKNDGPTIPEQQRERIFERFASFDASGSVASGIGLPLARELAKVNGGSLVLVPGEHVTFRLTLPRAEAGAQVEERGVPAALAPPMSPAMPGRSSPAAEPPRGRRRLLIVEDTPAMVALLEAVLGDQYATTFVGNLQRAAESIGAERPDLLLVDLMLPDGSGLKLLEQLPSLVSGVPPPVVFLSAAADEQVRVDALSRGAADFILKPFVAEELRARLAVAARAADEVEESLRRQREEFAAELHDGVNAALARAAMLLEAADRQQRTELMGPAREAVVQALDQARSLSVLRARVCVPLPAAASELELAMRSALAGFDVACELKASSDGTLSALTGVEQHTLGRLAVEASTNAIKHGRPKLIECALTVTAGTVELRVTSDGSAQNRAPAAGLGTGLGLQLASTRLDRLGGWLRSDAAEHGQWTVTAGFRGSLGRARHSAREANGAAESA